MRLDRAEEILVSSDNIEVLYQSNPVWIESIRKDSQLAHVKLLNSTDHLDVKVEDLTEAE